MKNLEALAKELRRYSDFSDYEITLLGQKTKLIQLKPDQAVCPLCNTHDWMALLLDGVWASIFVAPKHPIISGIL